MTITIQQLVSESYGTAKEKGWWDDLQPNIPEKFMLMVSELAEALEEFRAGRGLTEVYDGSCIACNMPPGPTVQDMGHGEHTGKPEGIPIELADVLIRIADLCGRYEIDLEGALRKKLDYNKTRPYRHGGKKC